MKIPIRKKNYYFYFLVKFFTHAAFSDRISGLLNFHYQKEAMR